MKRERAGEIRIEPGWETRPIAIALLETLSLASGIEAADAMIKQAPVRILLARPVSPGKWLTLLTGQVEEVRASLTRGREVAGDSTADELFLANPHPSIFPCLEGKVLPAPLDALGIVETYAVASCLGAADAALKQAAVQLIELRLAVGLGGKCYLTLTGEVSDVEASVATAAAVARSHGTLARRVVIPNPDPAMGEIVF